MTMQKKQFFTLFLILLFSSSIWASDMSSELSLDVKEFILENGMQFLIVERPTTPLVACRLAIRAGSAMETTGKTGIAHLLEHMMFKGTKNFGSRDHEQDFELQTRIEKAYQAILSEEQKRSPNVQFIKEKKAEMAQLRIAVQKLYVPQAFSAQLARNGGTRINAFTNKDQTQYMASLPSDMVELWFSMISEQLFEPAWREFYVEKEVVQREWAFRYVNKPYNAAYLDLAATAYTAHPYRNPVIGWRDDMTRYNTADAIEFHKQYYNPTNAVCVLVGDVTVESAKKMANIYFSRYPAGKRAPDEIPREPIQQGPRKAIHYLNGAKTPVVRLGYHAARMGTKDFYALDALIMILSNGRSARFRQNIVNKGFAVNAWAINPDNRYAGMLILVGSPNEPDGLKNKNLTEEEKKQVYLASCQELENILISEVEQLKTELVSVRELKRIAKLSQRDFLERLRLNEKLARSLANLEVQVGWRYVTSYLERIARVTPEDIRTVVQKYFRNANKTSVYVIPGGKPAQQSAQYNEVRSGSSAVTSRLIKTDTATNNSDFPTPPGWKHPLSFERKPEKITYPPAKKRKIKGASVFYLHDPELPLIDVTFMVKAGRVDEKMSQIGLTQLLSKSIIRGGTKRYSPDELGLILDENAIDITFRVLDEETWITLSVIKDQWEKSMDILAELLVHPRFDPTVLKVVQEQLLVDLKRQSDNAAVVARREGLIWHFKHHPYGRDPLHAVKTIPNLTPSLVRKFLKQYFVPSNMVISIAGDIEFKHARKSLKKLLAALPSQKAPLRKIEDPGVNSPVLALIDKPGQVQAQLVWNLRSVKRTNPSYWKIDLFMRLFGGDDSLLYKRLRDDLGLVYSAYAYQYYRWTAGVLFGYVGCKADKTGQAITETVAIMKQLRQEIPEAEFEQARLDALNGFVFIIESPKELLHSYGRYKLRGEPLDTLERIQDAFLSATTSELLQLTQNYLHPDKLQIFVIADKNTPVKSTQGTEISLEKDLQEVAARLHLPYQEISLR